MSTNGVLFHMSMSLPITWQSSHRTEYFWAVLLILHGSQLSRILSSLINTGCDFFSHTLKFSFPWYFLSFTYDSLFQVLLKNSVLTFLRSNSEWLVELSLKVVVFFFSDCHCYSWSFGSKLPLRLQIFSYQKPNCAVHTGV